MTLFATYWVIGALLIFVPGMALALAARARGFAVVAIAPALSAGIIGATAVIVSKAGLRFSLLSVAVFTVVACLIALAVTWAIKRRHPDGFVAERRPLRELLWAFAILAIIAVQETVKLRWMIPKPDAINQGYDNMFHLNAVQWIAQGHDPSSLTITSMTSGPTAPTFYPAAFHDWVGLMVMAHPHADVTVAMNAATYLTIGVLWPLALMYFIRALFPFSRISLFAAGLFGIITPLAPMPLLYAGPLYANLFALCILPAVLGFIVTLYRVGSGGQLTSPVTTASLILASVPGIALAHPNSLILGMIFWLAVTIRWWATGRCEATARAKRWRSVLLAGTAVIVVGAFVVLRPAAWVAKWEPPAPKNFELGAASMAFLSGARFDTMSLVAGVPALLGLVYALRHRRWWWLAGLHLVLAVIGILGIAAPAGALRYWATASWYCDPPRVTAILIITSVPLGVLGVHTLRVAAERVLNRHLLPRLRSAQLRRFALPAVAVAVLGLVLPLSFRLGSYQPIAATTWQWFDSTTFGLSVDDYERQAFREIPRYVPAGDVIATVPDNGSSLVYATTGIRTTTTHMIYTPSPELEHFNLHLNQATTDPAVCSYARANNVKWVLDFGEPGWAPSDWVYPGFDHLNQAPGFTPVYDLHGKVLYRLDACWK